MAEPRTIPEIPLTPSPTTDEGRAALGFSWAGGNVGRRHKLGGSPDWLYEAAVPCCQTCGAPMTFYAQLDSIGDAVCIADVGMIYVFVCFGCFETTNIVQLG